MEPVTTIEGFVGRIRYIAGTLGAPPVPTSLVSK